MSDTHTAQPLTSHPSQRLTGSFDIPGDKSISHRALILGALTVGETHISGLLEGDDIMATADAMRAFGAKVTKNNDGSWSVIGVGVGGFKEPDDIIDCGNAGTGARLIMGAMATTPISATFTGDASLRSRPMERITDPLALFGARSYGKRNGHLPLTIIGADNPIPVNYTTPKPSAQIKSAILLAGLNAPGETIVTEKEPTRDYTETMLASFGANIKTKITDAGHVITLQGQPELSPQNIIVPRDPSSAAFPICAALITPNSDITLPNIGLNLTRTGLFITLKEMGAHIELINEREEGGQQVADIRVKYSELHGITVPAERAASMIDEFPILSVAASFATGTTHMEGIKELRVKESDRIKAMVDGLRNCGVSVTDTEDSMTIHGMGPLGVPGGGTCVTHFDHRIAMSFFVLGLGSKDYITIDDSSAIATSFPQFLDLMKSAGAVFRSESIS